MHLSQEERQKFDQKFKMFFEDPRNEPKPPGTYGILYLLRRDISRCLRENPTAEKKMEGNPIIWPAAMLVMAGIDLLGKFYKGKDDTGKVGKRFINFLKNYFNICQEDAEIVYQLRNSLLHSFGLYSTKTPKKGKKSKKNSFISCARALLYKVIKKNKESKQFETIEYRFTVQYKGEQLVKKENEIENPKGKEIRYRIDLEPLREGFEKAVKNYEEDLKKDPDLQKKFLDMYENYGETTVS